jgi:hypothetical protein
MSVEPVWVFIPMGLLKPMTRGHRNPCPWLRAQVSTGTGTGCPGKPQGSPWHSLLVGWATEDKMRIYYSEYCASTNP